MRNLCFLSLALLLLASCDRIRINAPVERTDHQLSPEDLGAQKFTFQARAKRGQVVVFREDLYIDGKLFQRCDQVSNKRDGDYVQSVVFIDKSILSGTMNSGYILRTPGDASGDTLYTNARWKGSSSSSYPPKAEFSFKYNSDDHFNANKEFTHIYTIFTEPYGTAKLRIPALPDDVPPDSWTYSDVKSFTP
jgi:hypothetical protein